MSPDLKEFWQPPPIAPLAQELAAAMRGRIDGKAKPPGSLGRIEDLAVQLGMIRHPDPPRGDKAVLLVFAADHGLTEEGVSQYPSAVTVAMVMTYLAGRASANAFAAASNATICVIDAGVAADLPVHPNLISAKIRMGTANAAREPAMTPQQAADALARGCGIAIDQIAAGADIIALGEMGIGNTASSALLAHRLAPATLQDCIGVGAGQDDTGMARKRAAIEKAAARSNATAPFDVLVEFGGLEIAAMAGALLGAASQRRPVLVDGFISSAAALLAIRLCPAARDYCIFAHRSAEKGHDVLLAALDAKPLLDLGLRLGEGTGALLAVPLVRAAARLLTDVADLSDVLAGNIEMDGNEFMNALRFMTIVPVLSSDAAARPDWLSRCAKYFPAVGICIGLASATVLLLAGAVWGPVIAALLAVAASIIVTGALHEDGLADTADGFGGGWSVEKRLAIMKDSRIGAYGVLALAFGIALRVTALAEMPFWSGAAALIAAHAAARITPAFVMNALPYAGDTAAMKVSYADAPVSAHDLRFALVVVLCALAPLALVSIPSVISGLLLGAILAAAVVLWARKLIDGYTGDVLGATEQMFEIGFLLGVTAIIR